MGLARLDLVSPIDPKADQKSPLRSSRANEEKLPLKESFQDCPTILKGKRVLGPWAHSRKGLHSPLLMEFRKRLKLLTIFRSHEFFELKEPSREAQLL